MKTKLTVVAAPNISDAARTLVKLASEVATYTKRVSAWAKNPAAHDLNAISSEVGERTQALQNAVRAHLEADRPSLANMEWRCKVAEDRASRAWDKFHDEFHEWHTPEWEATRQEHEQAYQAYLQSRRELRAHPEWKPKNPKKPRAVTAAKKRETR